MYSECKWLQNLLLFKLKIVMLILFMLVALLIRILTVPFWKAQPPLDRLKKKTMITLCRQSGIKFRGVTHRHIFCFGVLFQWELIYHS